MQVGGRGASECYFVSRGDLEEQPLNIFSDCDAEPARICFLSTSCSPPPQADEMLKALDTDGSGNISYAEFVGGFKLIDTKPRSK